MAVRNRGFTLLELIVVVIIIGVLATLGFTQYTRLVERGRTAEAKMILGQIRTAQEAYNQEYGEYGDIANISVEAPGNCTGTTHYFSYAGSGDTATATRCGTGTGKTPGSAAQYKITLNYTSGVFGGSPGYY